MIDSILSHPHSDGDAGASRASPPVDLYAAAGQRVLGDDPPEVLASVREAIARGALAAPSRASALVRAAAERLGRAGPGDLVAAHLLPSRGEAIDAALRLARRVTRRRRLVGTQTGSHGTSIGALSMGARDGQPGPSELLLDVALVPFGDLAALERVVRSREVAAFVVEPIAVEAGVQMPPPGYLALAAELCRRHGALLVLDESRIGLGRAGALFACQTERLEPDVLVVGESLAAGLFPAAACLCRRGMWDKAFGLSAPVHVPGEPSGPAAAIGALAAAAAVATLEVLVRDRLPERAARVGARLGIDVRIAASESPLVHTVRGRGLLWGLELKPQAAVRAVTLGMIDRLADPLVARRLAEGLAERGFHVEPATLDPAVVRISPSLVIDESALGALPAALAEALDRHAGGLVRATLDAVGDALAGRAARLVGRSRRRRDGGGDGDE